MQRTIKLQFLIHFSDLKLTIGDISKKNYCPDI